MFGLILDETAKIDFDQAAGWYGERSPGLDEKFLDEIERTLNFIRKNPLLYPRIGHGLRKAKINNFPYSLYYYVLQDQIIMIGCLHNARDRDQILQERT